MKKILYVLLGLVAVYLILCMVGPGHIKVERSIDVNASTDLVKTKLADYHFFFEQWSPWTEKDPGMKTTYIGEAGKEGHSITWESDKKEVGHGTMTYKGMHNDTVVHNLYFEGQGDSKGYQIVVANGAGSKVTWGMESDFPFIFRAIMLFMDMDKMIGADFEKGLGKLKTAMESIPAEIAANYEVMEMNWDAKTFYGVKNSSLSMDKASEFFGASYGQIGAAMGKAKAKMISAPSAIYFSFDEKTMVADVAAVMEVPNGTKLEGVEKFETPAGKVLHIEYYGAYEKSGNAHYAMDAYMKEKGLTQSFVLEEYVTDPMNEKDTAKWLTNIYYLVK